MGSTGKPSRGWVRRSLRSMLVIAILAGVSALDAGRGAATTAGDLSSSGGRATAQKPNIVLILSDDQRWDTQWAMPNVRSMIVRKGVEFTDAYVVNPLCCPSRTTILTGLYSHSTGVYTNEAPHGGFTAFHDRVTIATRLDARGYTTAMIGKYLNEYRPAALQGYRPPGWDRWVAFAEDNGKYVDYDLTIDGRIRHYDEAVADYSTDVLGDYADSFIRHARGPLFLYFAPTAPHDPATPAARDRDTFQNLAPYRGRAFNEADVSDKPRWAQRPPLTPQGISNINWFRRSQYRSLLSVDRAVARIVHALADTGRLRNTLLVYMSDNGFMWGEHRLTNKQAPYEESIRVPMAIRYDRAGIAPHRDAHLALNLDLAPTFAAAAGTTMPNAAGRNLLPLMRDQAHTAWRSEFLVEHAMSSQKVPIPSYVALHTDHSVYVLYSTGAQEYYDLANDPFQLQNLVHRAAVREIVRRMRTRVLGWARPLPPGFPDLS